MSDGGRIVITIDGPAASGKSSTAQWVAERLGYLHVDSGSLYRALTAATLRGGIDPEQWTPDLVLQERSRVGLRASGDKLTAAIDGADADEEIRGNAVTAEVWRVASMPEVRSWVNGEV